MAAANIDPALNRLRQCQILSVGIGFIAAVTFVALGLGEDAEPEQQYAQETFNNNLPKSKVDELSEDKLTALHIQENAEKEENEEMDGSSFDLLGKAEEQARQRELEAEQLRQDEARAKAEIENLEQEREERMAAVARETQSNIRTAQTNYGRSSSSFDYEKIHKESEEEAYRRLQKNYGKERFPDRDENKGKAVAVATAPEKAEPTEKKITGFNSVVGGKRVATHDIRAVVHGTHRNLTNNSQVKLRLLDPMVANGVTIPRNAFVYGKVSFSAGRLQIAIDNVNYQDNVLPFKAQIYDQDGSLGIYVPDNAISEAGRDAGGSSVSGTNTTITTARSGSLIGAGVNTLNSGVNAVKNAVTKKTTENKVSISANYKVTIREDKK